MRSAFSLIHHTFFGHTSPILFCYFKLVTNSTFFLILFHNYISTFLFLFCTIFFSLMKVIKQLLKINIAKSFIKENILTKKGLGSRFFFSFLRVRSMDSIQNFVHNIPENIGIVISGRSWAICLDRYICVRQ